MPMSTIRPAIASVALGQARAGHGIEKRLAMAQKHGFTGVVLSFDDVAFIAQMLPEIPTPDSPLVRAAAVIRGICETRDLTVTALLPFRHMEGLRCRKAMQNRLNQLKCWATVAHALGTEMIVVYANELDREHVVGDDATLAQDLRDAADTVLPLRLAYMATPTATFVDRWPRAWALVQAADRSNLGLGLDVGLLLETELGALRDDVCASRVFHVQAGDVLDMERTAKVWHEKKNPFLDPVDDTRDTRGFYGEAGRTISADALRVLGYCGWVGLDVAVRRTTDTDRAVPKEMARRGWTAWTRLAEDVAGMTAAARRGRGAGRALRGLIGMVCR